MPFLVLAIAASGAEAPARRALLIGINDYAAPSIPDLRGAVNDVVHVRRILITRFGFEAADIVTITDAQATKREILRQLDALIAASTPADRVYLHYSGHGSQVPDRSGDEPDGKDETILPHDARQPGVADIVDDELYARLGKLRAASALFVFDSCHSGTVMRLATPVQPRFVPPDERIELYPAGPPATRDIVAVERTPYVLMAGAPADQETLDGPVDEGWFGLFSYSLARALETLGPPATPAALHAAARGELERIRQKLYTRPPDPTLEGPGEMLQRPLFDLQPADAAPSEVPARRSWVAVRRIDSDRLRLVSGLDLNARPGSQWAVFPPTDTRFELGNAIAVGTVERIDGSDAILRVNYAAEAIPDGARAISLSPATGSANLPVRFEGSPAVRLQAIESTLSQRMPTLRFARPGEFARFIVIHDTARWRVMDAGGLQEIVALEDSADDVVVSALLRLFTSARNAITLLGLENAASTIRVDVRTVKDGGSQAGDREMPVVRIRRADEPRTAINSLRLEVRTNVDAYLSIASVNTEGGVTLLFPNPHQRAGFLPDGLVSANVPVRIPDGLQPDNRAGFHWDYSAPAGRETIRVFAARDRATAQVLRDFIARSAADPARLEELRSVLAQRVVRGTEARGSWTAVSLSLQVLP